MKFARFFVLSFLLSFVSVTQSAEVLERSNKLSQNQLFNLVLDSQVLQSLNSPHNVKKQKYLSLVSEIVVPVIVTGFVCCVLYQNYETVTVDFDYEFSFSDFCSLKRLKRKAKRLGLQFVEIIFAVAKLSLIRKKNTTLSVDILRILSSLLFLINKNQFTKQSFKDGAYYIQAWLIYDICCLIKDFGKDPDSFVNSNNTNVVVEDGKFKYFNNILSFYVLPVAESMTSFYLACNLSDVGARKKLLSAYSLLRVLFVYLKAQKKTANSLLIMNLLAVLLNPYNQQNSANNYSQDNNLSNSEDNSTDNFSQDFLKDDNDQDNLQDLDNQQDFDENISEQELDNTSESKDNNNKEHNIESNQEEASNNQLKTENKVFDEQPNCQPEIYINGVSDIGIIQECNFVIPKNNGSFIFDKELIKELKQKIDAILDKYPVAKNVIQENNVFADLDSEEVDNRSIRIILEEKLSYLINLLGSL